MTMITKALTDPKQREKWRVQAQRIAASLKQVVDFGSHPVITTGIVFDDLIIKVTLPVDLIQQLDVAELAKVIFEAAQQVVVEPDNEKRTLH
jgi:hypothetical protein